MMNSVLTLELEAAVFSQDVQAVREVLHKARAAPRSKVSQRSQVSPTSQCDLGQALCKAAELGAVDIVKELLRIKADLSYVDARGLRPIHCAALGPSTEVLKLIIRSGSPLTVPDENGASALHHAVERANREMVALLVNEGATITKIKSHINGETPLHIACRMGDDIIARMILKRNVYYNERTRDKRTPLMYAIGRQHLTVVHTLCEFGVDLNIPDHKGNTSLHLAINSHLPSVNILLQHNVNPNATNCNGETPLHTAAFQHHNLDAYHNVAELLIQYGSNLHTRDMNGQTALHAATLAGNAQVAKLLILNGSDVNERDSLSGDTPLHLAVTHCKNQLMELLVENGADVTICETSGGMSPLHRIFCSRNPEKCKYMNYLISHGAKVNEVNARGYTPIDCCVFYSTLGGFEPDCLLNLVQAGALLKPVSLPKSNIQHHSPLCWLTWHGNLPVARFLVECGWDLRHENWIRLRGRSRDTVEFLSYVWTLVREPRPLRHLCRIVIREYYSKVSGDTNIIPLVNSSQMPTLLKRFINLEMEVEACHLDMEAEKQSDRT